MPIRFTALSVEILRMKRGQMISCRTAMRSYGDMLQKLNYTVVKSWLFSTAYHNMIDIIRKEKRMTTLEPAHENEMVYESQYSDLNEILHEALETASGTTENICNA